MQQQLRIVYQSFRRSQASCKLPLSDYRGFGLLEILLAIAVAGIITIISVNYYTNVRNEQKMNFFINQLRSLSSSIMDYINTNNGKDISAIFANSNVTSILLKDGAIQPADVQNVWSSGFQYQITLTPQATIYHGSVPCLVMQVVVDVPQQVNATVLQNKVIAAFHKPQLQTQTGTVYSGGIDDVSIRQYQSTNDYYINIQFCLD